MYRGFIYIYFYDQKFENFEKLQKSITCKVESVVQWSKRTNKWDSQQCSTWVSPVWRTSERDQCPLWCHKLLIPITVHFLSEAVSWWLPRIREKKSNSVIICWWHRNMCLLLAILISISGERSQSCQKESTNMWWCGNGLLFIVLTTSRKTVEFTQCVGGCLLIFVNPIIIDSEMWVLSMFYLLLTPTVFPPACCIFPIRVFQVS